MASLSPVASTAVSSASKVKGNSQQQSMAQAISSDVLDDLASRFIINVPVQERENLIRICFQIELAHWFYLDFYCSSQKQKCGIKQFAVQLFQHIPFLQPHLAEVNTILEYWKQYKLTVPTYGAILLSEDLKHVLLVQSFWAKSSWGFPKGKINENEEPVNCAIREVYEETGYDIKSLIVPTEFIELVINYQFTRLYLVKGVPLSTVFTPKTRNEIKSCEWFPIDLLPVTKNENFVKDNLSMTGNSFFMILPFVKKLKKWLEKGPKGNKSKGSGGGGVGGSAGQNQSPVGFGSVGKQKFFDNKPATGGSSSNRQRQRHKSLGDLDQQHQQRSKSSGAQYFSNNNSGNQQTSQHQQPFYSNNTPSNANIAAMTKGSYEPGKTGASGAKTKAECMVPVSVLKPERLHGKTQTKRKLFESSSTAASTQDNSSNAILATLGENVSWLNFKLDFSKFV